ncbi:lamin tail domain-containing protein [Marilutibacter chinensis]|uniref:Lamin tail domain-containing protein n=1 Tax=Marilutibacter chinensis TaxID=2912247 RepID=A0ABS9HR22_9GAMM|nr:lamin tail domain-containing protein [Lysobacter chinensis]MCF7221376.1 lamin tail domain-containing protein [Lysobacter chinensis]
MHISPGRRSGRLLVAVLGVVSLAAFAGHADAQVVVSQVYGGGGNSGATWRNDFIELRNNGASAVDLTGWSVQYASSSGSSWQRTELSGSIAPGGYYLVQQAQGSGGTADLPAPDAIGTISMSSSNGKVALVNGGGALSGTCPLTETVVVDFVGFGSANCFEGASATPSLNNTSAALRNGDGSVDTDDNGADFTRGEPNPRNSGAEPPDPPDPPVALSISQIQGDGLVSPHVDKAVITEGVVTALKFNNGFFLQSANDDGNPATSDGIFVFTGSAPTVAVGDNVRVTATVTEFTPSSNPNQLGITELVTPTIEVLSTGAALPVPVELTAAELGPDALPGTLERLEGMRVSVAEAVVIAASGGRLDENDARASTDGVFHVTLPGVARPFREAGIGVLDTIQIPADKDPPRFDTNPERLMVRSWGQVGATPLSVDADAQVAGLLGVLDYYSGTWALLPDAATPPTVSGGRLPEAVNDPDYDEVTIASFNLLRLFDEIADGNGAVTLTPEALDRRLAKAASAICDYLKAPDVLGVVEVENARVLQLLSDRIDAGCPAAPGYVPYLEPGNDVGGINVGFLVSSRAVEGGVARVEVLDVTQFGKDTLLNNPDGSTSLLNDRPPLRLRARIHQDAGTAYPVTVIVNHLRSLNGIDDSSPGSSGWATTSERVRAKRGAQAAYLAGLVEQFQQADPDERIVLVGDFNAFEVNDGYVDVMGIVRGEAAPADQVLTWVDSPLTTPLVDGSQLIPDPAERYSYVFAGSAQTLDHVLVNETLAMDAAMLEVDHARINADFGVDNFDDASIAIRSSDHDPVRLSIAVPAFRRADLSVSASSGSAGAEVGDTVRFDASVANAGPGEATVVAVAFVFDALLSPSLAGIPADWGCTVPRQDTDANTTTITCHANSLDAGATTTFAIDAIVPASSAGDALRLGVAAQSQVNDPANADNQASVTVPVAALGSADLSVRLIGSAHPLRRNTIATFLAPVRNAGPDAAANVRLVVEGNVEANRAAIAAPRGWSCSRATGTAAGFRAECTREGEMTRGTQWLAFAVVVPGRPAGGETLSFSAEVDSDTPDPRSGNNRDTLDARIGRGHARGR